VRTQILRTRQELTNIIEVRKSSGSFLVCPIHYFFSRDKRDKRGIGETFLSRADIDADVTNVANLNYRSFKDAKIVQFPFQVRKNCVISLFFPNDTLLFSMAYSRDYESLASAVGQIFLIIDLHEV
jgi:hypothetical protein